MRTLYTQQMLRRGFLAAAGYYPTLAHTERDMRLFEHAAHEVFGEIADAVRREAVVESLIGSPSQDVLTPAERDITVLFCDVRGFSRQAEQLQDQLPRLLESVRAALGVMVNCIIERDGTIADLQGDAALGFWGWPVSLPGADSA